MEEHDFLVRPLQPLTEIVGNGEEITNFRCLTIEFIQGPRFLSISMTILTDPYKLGNYIPVAMAQEG